MVSQNDSNQPPSGKKPTGSAPSPLDIEGVQESLNAEYRAQFDTAIERRKAGDLKGAAEIARRAIKASEAKGGAHEASVILTFLPALYPGAPLSEFRENSYRVIEILKNSPNCEALLSQARFYTMQVELKEKQTAAALREAHACILAAKSAVHQALWLATAWRYYGMLLGLKGLTHDALLAISNAIQLAEAKQTDDPLCLAKSQEAMGRTLLSIGKVSQAEQALKTALQSYSQHGQLCKKEISAIKSVLENL